MRPNECCSAMSGGQGGVFRTGSFAAAGIHDKQLVTITQSVIGSGWMLLVCVLVRCPLGWGVARAVVPLEQVADLWGMWGAEEMVLRAPRGILSHGVEGRGNRVVRACHDVVHLRSQALQV